MKRWIIAAAAVTGLMALPATAAANICGGGSAAPPQLFDSQGYYFDFNNAGPGTTPDQNDAFATFDDSGSNGPTDTPPGPVSSTDTYDKFGALFVGGTDNAHLYFSADNNSCSDPASGEHDFPVVPMNGLNVQRKVFVNPSGPLPGARILNLIGNPGSAPVTTNVQLGDLTSGDNEGDLGSDDTTEVRASSNGDLAASPADFWAVTNDDPTATSDNTVAHIVDGPGGAVKANLFQIGGGTDAQPQDNVAWGWTVTIPAHRTIGLMSFEAQQADTTLASGLDAGNALAVANSYEAAPRTTLYAGMSTAEAASVVNWAQAPVCLKKKKKKHHGKKSATSAKKHKKQSNCKKHKKHKKHKK
jgi:hypothetical protein